MPTARETLLDAAHVAVRAQPWALVRMVDVAAAAGVSRQTLYNEFGSKEGLGAALVSRLIEDFLDGAGRAVADACGRGADPAACCAAAAHWILRTARTEPIVYAALTGCWGPRMPVPSRPARSHEVARAFGREVLPDRPGQLTAVLRSRALSGLDQVGRVPVGGPPTGGVLQPGARPARHDTGGRVGRDELERAYEAGLRIALSYVVAPPPQSADSADATDSADVTDSTDAEPCGRVREVVSALLAD
jgi:AcrR family transcriptional regulator